MIVNLIFSVMATNSEDQLQTDLIRKYFLKVYANKLQISEEKNFKSAGSDIRILCLEKDLFHVEFITSIKDRFRREVFEWKPSNDKWTRSPM